jgi:hypothetical protein
MVVAQTCESLPVCHRDISLLRRNRVAFEAEWT